jgi:phytoene dehydrogenase-like protein
MRAPVRRDSVRDRLKDKEGTVVGSGPNGLTAAILLTKSGLKTTVFEAQETFGGGARSEFLTIQGFVHDICSAVHPMAVCSPVLESFPLAKFGLEWILSPAALLIPV